MQFHDKNIESLIHQITGQNTPQEHSLPPSTPSLTQIRNILLIATPYDYFLLEEEGRLSELFKQVYIKRDASYIPQIIQVNSGTEALEYITTHHPDLIVLFNIPRDTDLFTLAAELKTRHSDIPLIFLANNTPELERIQALKEATLFNWIFTWQGDGKIFLSIVSFVEDICNASSETQQFNTRNILLIESSIQHYSTYLQLLYDAIWQHIETLLLDELSQPQKILRQKRRPKILLATTEKQAKTLIDRYQNRLLFIIDGLSITEKIKQQEHQHTSNTLPPTLIIINTSKTKKPSTQDTITYLSKTNTNHMAELQEYINNNLGIKPLIFHDKTGKIITTAENIRTFEQVIWAIPGEILLTYAQQGILTRWLEQHTEFELAQTFHTIITKC
ncbi:MAG: response regulator, partial [Candidatus Thermoplasmatota archaeon]|nr:response regulator [Candidatus Thermoplasmatota archaeon]